MNKMMMLSLAAVWCIGAVPYAFAGSDRIEDHIFSSNFRKVYHNRLALMEEKRPPLRFDSGVMVYDCKEYLEAEITSSSNNYFLECEYDICHVLDAFAKAAVPSDYKPESYTKELLERLEWRGIIDGFESEQDSRRTLAAINDPLVKIVDKYGFERLKEEVLYFSFTVISDADLNGNSKPDWLFSYNDKWLGGSGFTCATGVIWDVGPTGPLLVDVYPLTPK